MSHVETAIFFKSNITQYTCNTPSGVGLNTSKALWCTHILLLKFARLSASLSDVVYTPEDTSSISSSPSFPSLTFAPFFFPSIYLFHYIPCLLLLSSFYLLSFPHCSFSFIVHRWPAGIPLVLAGMLVRFFCPSVI